MQGHSLQIIYTQLELPDAIAPANAKEPQPASSKLTGCLFARQGAL